MAVAVAKGFGAGRFCRGTGASIAGGFLAVLLYVHPLQAQVSLNPAIPGDDDLYDVCAGEGGSLFIPIDDDCEVFLVGNDFFSVTGLTIGPAASQIFLNSSTGAATFGGAATFNAATTFNSGFTVGSGQTVNMGGNRVQNVATPTAGTDAANKQYVDDQNATQNTRITAVEGVNATQQTQINSNTANIATNTANIATNTTNIATNTANIATNTTNIASLQVQANDADRAIASLQSDVNRLDERDDELAEGIAISLALDAPILRTGQTFAMRGGWGNFDGANAAGVTAAGLVAPNVVLDAGVGFGTNEGTVAGKGGVTIGW